MGLDRFIQKAENASSEADLCLCGGWWQNRTEREQGGWVRVRMSELVCGGRGRTRRERDERIGRVLIVNDWIG